MQRPHLLTTVLIGVASLVVGCDATYKDVSGEATHRHLIGAVCRVQFPLNAYGVTMTLEREKKTDLVVLSALRLSGPEITFSTFLDTGTQLQVLAVRQCTNCPFETRISYQARVTPEPKQFTGKPVYLDAEPMSSGQVECKAAKMPNPALNTDAAR